MPWCDECSEYYAPAVLADGACPTCGGPVEDGHAHESQPMVGKSAPWHFWLVVVLLAAYLLWRLVDLVIWIFS
jgi:hypothetical protein